MKSHTSKPKLAPKPIDHVAKIGARCAGSRDLRKVRRLLYAATTHNRRTGITTPKRLLMPRSWGHYKRVREATIKRNNP